MTAIGSFEFTARLWRAQAGDAWYFVSVPPEVSADIDDLSEGIRRGFGSVRVRVTVGATSWRTSIFPHRKSGTYMLPMKKAVRAGERLEDGDELRARVELVDL